MHELSEEGTGRIAWGGKPVFGARLGILMLEGTNMAPYARALQQRLRLPIFDIYAVATWFHAGLVPRDFGPPGSGPRDWRER
jgi:hypothetical protein